jgi:hypothetical protein
MRKGPRAPAHSCCGVESVDHASKAERSRSSASMIAESAATPASGSGGQRRSSCRLPAKMRRTRRKAARSRPLNEHDAEEVVAVVYVGLGTVLAASRSPSASTRSYRSRF